MNILRSTERSLTLLSFKGASKCKRLGVQQKNFTKKFCLFQRTIKTTAKCLELKENQAEPILSTVSFINPNKPTPNQATVLPPILPLTLPTFPRNSGGAPSPPSITKILQETMPAASRFILDRWRKSMIEKLGQEGFEQYEKDTFKRGKDLHALLASYLLKHGDPAPTDEVVTNLWTSIEKVVKEKISNVRLVEHRVYGPDMKYRGVVDCVAFYEDELVVIDFKTSEKPKKDIASLYDNPLQVTAYCGAINNDKNIPSHIIDRNICSGVVIVAYIDGSEASTFYMNSDQVTSYWKQWTARVEQYYNLLKVDNYQKNVVNNYRQKKN